jgi:hypothetical protein
MLLCGLAIDSGLLYLAKARLGRAVDGAALTAVGNFNRSSDPTTNRDDVALIMRNFAVANYTGLSSISADVSVSGGSGGAPTTTTGANGQQQTSYQYNFNDGTQDANGQYRRFVQVTLNTGSGGNITSATCNARCPVQTFFIGYGYYFLGNGVSKNYAKIGGYSGPSSLVDLKVSSSAVATRNPRLIEVIIDRSASMLAKGGGASGLPPAIVQFLDFFDTSADNIGIVSFGTAARVEMPITTNFLIAGTNNLSDAYNTLTNSPDPQADVPCGVPGLDPEIITDPGYATNGVRRLKFGGSTCADDGIRLGLEQMMANAGFNDPDVIKYMVIFTDGQWNTARTMFAAPGYTNRVTVPTADATHVFVTNGASAGTPIGSTNGPWNPNNLASNTNLMLMPSLSPLPGVTNAIAAINPYDFSVLAPAHYKDVWLSADGTANEPLGPQAGTQILGGTAQSITNTSWVGSNNGTAINYYTHNFDVWLQPGAVAYCATNNGNAIAYVSDYTNPTKHINLIVGSGGAVDLIVPGYIADGTFYDGLDLPLPDSTRFGSGPPKYRADNFQQAFEWSDDANSVTASQSDDANYQSSSLQRQLAFRNYVNLLTGFYISDPDDPSGPGREPLITEQSPNGAPRPLFGLGPYYPGAPYYFPFGGETNAAGWVTNAMGITYDPTYALMNPSEQDPDTDQTYQIGGTRHNAYSINMLSPMAAPQWSGELFYKSATGGGTTVLSGNGSTSASQIMKSADWKNQLPNFAAHYDVPNLMINETTHNASISGSPSVWRPVTFNGSNFTTSYSAISESGGPSITGGYVADGPQGLATTHYYYNAMAYSGRPSHYYDFSQSKWIPVGDNHTPGVQALPLGNWKAWEYAWHARALGVTIYTVGYGLKVLDAQQAYLAQIANATNTTAGGGTAIAYNPSQPIGQEFYATNATQISNDFYSVGQAINEALTGGQ